jgi:argininosuccinate synthase
LQVAVLIYQGLSFRPVIEDLHELVAKVDLDSRL